MGYPENMLTDDERVVIHKHPHWKTLVWPTIAFLVIVGGGSYLAALAQDLSWNQIAWISLAVLGGVLILWLFVTPLVRWRSTHFVVTSERVMVREGVLHRTGIDIPLSRINSVRFQHSLIDRVLGCGTLIIESASEEPLEFDDIPSVERVHGLLYHQINDDDDGDYYYRSRPQRDPD
ncbi:hypothetical protein C1701_14490 [Actinoalloteichus sp. AHMU CJ021]|uniref:PH domain-containing protein n=1 Tax=Actinoalloteichus caeruleus DSM 43889 TaxID=1120930 RepID=A0ABT1JMB0_ACTCY|nr:PH domain-containing protein [Actinoalloteichus caeruleus]AUS79372.1 hypothetical protein C1701_14490 [Actinoalloteichus sp. AHMU CJ021]MCP2333665.1 PH domain-containing protein [Actinoalloteichus caeruleus DSM 43889]